MSKTVNRSVTSFTIDNCYDVAVCTTQKPPFIRPLPYSRVRATLESQYGEKRPNGDPVYMVYPTQDAGENSIVCTGSFHGPYRSQMATVRNKALDKLQAWLAESPQGAVALAERKEAMSMMTTRLRQMAWFTKTYLGVLKGRPASLAQLGAHFETYKALRQPGRAKATIKDGLKKWRTGARSAGDLFLEWHFGWDPLYQDIIAAIDLLQSDLPNKKFKVRSSHPVERNYAHTVNHKWWFKSTSSGKICVTIGGAFKVTNPNLYLWQRSGFVNLPSVAWELIPFSFLVDHVVNVGQWLNQFTDFLGLELIDPYCTTTLKVRMRGMMQDASGYPSGAVSNGLYIVRTTSLPGVTLQANLPSKISTMRGLTYASLLAGLLKEVREVKPK